MKELSNLKGVKMLRSLVFVLCSLLSQTYTFAGGTNSSGNAVVSSSPEKAVSKMIRSMCVMNKREVRACFAGTDEELRAIESVANFGNAALHFKAVFIKTYGAKAWSDFQDPDKAPQGGDTRFSLIETNDVVALIKDSTIRLEGAVAYFKIPNEDREGEIIQQESIWLVSARSFLPAGAEPKAFSALMNQLASAVKKYETAIGQKNVSGEDIDNELGRTIAYIMFGIKTTDKHRFNIDAL